MQIEEFKKSVGKFPTGVTIISTLYNSMMWGFTANSFVSVSLTPSLVSFCLSKNSGSFLAFNNSNHFAISILASDQAFVAKHFATKISDKFSSIEYQAGFFGSPLIQGSVCHIECSKYDQFECGDHVIFIGEVKQTKTDEKKLPLVYFAKSYQSISKHD